MSMDRLFQKTLDFQEWFKFRWH